MGRNNYKNYYKEKEENKDENVIEETKVTEEVAEPEKVDENVIEETEVVEDKGEETTPEFPIGLVYNCINLNIRRTANKLSGVIGIVPKDTKVEILDMNGSSKFYKVRTLNDFSVEGYCMKDYIKII